MKLKKLDIYGFKSFADRTIFEFEDDLTALVGPNGSGKSNVVDALKWVLGERSARKLRGAEMANVIFNGSKGTKARRPLNFADVTLTIDNSNGWLPVEYEEVAIRRRVERSGESDYFINGKRCRLKDICNLLMDTGVGTASYSFIEQGQISRLLTADARERRGVFEEAAGIHRFLQQKREAERKLERVSANLARVTDIIEELQRQLRSVKYQAGRARVFKKNVEELQQLRLAYNLHKWRELEGDRESREEAIRAADETRRRLQEAAVKADADIESARADLQRAQGDLVQSRERLTHIEARIESLAREEELNVRRREELQTEREQLDQRRQALSERLANLQADADHAAADLEGTVKELKDKSTACEERRRGIETAQQECRRCENALEAGKNEVFAQLQQQSQLRNQMEFLASEKRATEGRLDKLQTRRRELSGQINEVEVERAQAEGELAALSSEQELVASRMDGLKQDLAECSRELDALSAREAEARTELSGKRGRRDVLRDLERRAEGLNSGVKKLREADLKGLVGIVAELIDVPLEHATAVDAALGEKVQAVAWEGTADALEALRLLAQDKSGRAELLVLERICPAPRIELPDGEGLVGRLSDLIGFAPAVEAIVEFLLGNTFLVSDSEAAAALLEAGLRPGLRLVTPNGECYGGDGVWAGGEPQTPSLISRRSELAELQEDIRTLQAAIAETADRKKACALRLQGLGFERDDLTGRIQEMNRALGEVRGRLNMATLRAHDLREEMQLGHDEEAVLRRDMQGLDERRAELDAEYAAAEHSHAEARKAIEADRQTLLDAQQRRQTLAEEAGELASGLARVRERHESLQLLQQRLRADLRNAETEVGAIEAQCNGNARRREESLAAAEATRNESMRLRAEKVALAAALETRSAGLQSYRDRIDDLTGEARRTASERESLEEALHGLRLAESETNIKIQDLLERTAEEYGVRLRALELEPERWREMPLFTSRPIREFMAEAPPPEEPEPAAAWYQEMGPTGEQEPDDAAPAQESEIVSLEDATALRRRVLEMANAPDTDWASARERVARLKAKVDRIGNVNVGAIAEQEKIEVRLQFLTDQKADLETARRHEREIIRELNKKSRERFRETFEEVRANFQRLFRKLFGGGSADIVLDEQAEDVLEAGIEMLARPPGKETNSITLLSGGEKALTTVALLFAMFQAKPSPFCLLDEVDAPLDDSNVERFLMMLEEFQANTQFIVITHNKLTMSMAQALYGLTMTDGVSQKISVRFEDVEETLDLRDPDLARAG